MKKVDILRGPSGVGKDHWIKENGEGHVHVCSTDAYFTKPSNPSVVRETSNGLERLPPIYTFDVKKLSMAHQSCMEDFLTSLASDHVDHIIVNNTNTREWEWLNYYLAAQLIECRIRIVEFNLTSREQLQLCAKRNVHGVPLHTIAAQWARFEPVDIKEYPDVVVHHVSPEFPFEKEQND